jgi:hypothetical protein
METFVGLDVSLKETSVCILNQKGALVFEGKVESEPACLPQHAPPCSPPMFVVTEAAAAAIRAIFEQEGELSAAIELRRLFPGVTDNAKAQECARTIAGWQPQPVPGGR